MIAALLAGLMALTAPAGARASSLLANGGFEDFSSAWSSGDLVYVGGCTNFLMGCAPGTSNGETRAGFLSRLGTVNTAQSTTQTVAGVGPGLYEFGVWVSLVIDESDNNAGDLSQAQVSLLGQTSGATATDGAQPNDLPFQTRTDIFGLTLQFTDWFLLSGVLDLTQTESVIFNINLQADPRTEGANSLRMLFDNAYLRKVEQPAAVIPLPAAGWLLLGALGALTALRRRRG
jgi:hypothetical protein